MNLKDKVERDFQEALKNRKGEIISTLRLLKAAFQNKEIELRKSKKEFDDQEALKVIQSEIKKREESIEAFEKGGRNDLVKKEKEEISLLKKYLPPQLSDEEVKKIVNEVIQEIGEVSEKSFGLIMKETMPRIKGRAEGARVSRIVKEILSKK